MTPLFTGFIPRSGGAPRTRGGPCLQQFSGCLQINLARPCHGATAQARKPLRLAHDPPELSQQERRLNSSKSDKSGNSEQASPATLKVAARSQLDVSSFTPVGTEAASTAAAEQSAAADAFASKLSLGLYKVQRFYFAGDQVRKGQVQQVIAVAPGEAVEVVTQTTRRISREDEYESTNEFEQSSSTETKDMSEVSDVVSRTLTDSATTSVSATVGGSIGVVSASASSNQQQQSIDVTSTQHAAKTVKEVVIKSADRMKRSVRVKVKNVQELTEVNSSRRQIKNPSATQPMNIAVRAALREETVVCQNISTQLCLKIELENPGAVLVIGELPVPPRPTGLSVPKQFEATVAYQTDNNAQIDLFADGLNLDMTFGLPADAEVDFITKNGVELVNFVARNVDSNDGHAIFTNWPDASVVVLPSVNPQQTRIGYQLPKGKVQGIYKKGLGGSLTVRIFLKVSVNAKVAWDSELLKEQLATNESRGQIGKRSEKDLRDEERLAILQKVGEKLKTIIPPEAVGRLRDILDLEAMWYSIFDDGLNLFPKRKTYLITPKISPAPFGIGLGWEEDFAWDGDKLRNVFLRAEGATVYLPIHPRLEETVINALLKANIDLGISFDDDARGLLPPKADMPAKKPNLKPFCNYLVKRQDAISTWSDQDGDRIDPGDVPFAAESMTPLQLAGLTDAGKYAAPSAGSKAGEDAKVLFPVVDRFKITTPVDGFFYEVIPD